MPASVCSIVDDVGAIEFYREQLAFDVDMHPAPGFAALRRGDLRLFLNAPGAGGAGRAGGGNPETGGWNRFQDEVDDLSAFVGELRDGGVTVRGEIINGQGGEQAIAEDPSGNPIALFQPKH